MVSLNWWMKPITRENTIELNPGEKFQDLMIRMFIRTENQKIDLPPGIDDTPTTSEATTVDEDGHYSDEIPLKSSRKSQKEPKIIFNDEKL